MGLLSAKASDKRQKKRLHWAGVVLTSSTFQYFPIDNKQVEYSKQKSRTKDIWFKVIIFCCLKVWYLWCYSPVPFVGVGQVVTQMKFFGTVPASSPMVPGTPA